MQKTIQMTLDGGLLKSVDTLVTRLKMTRSGFIRKSLEYSLKQYQSRCLEKKHRLGYVHKPVKDGEFSVWEEEQEWGDE